MQFEHDSEADAVYVRLSLKPYSYGRDLDDYRRIDYAVDGTPIGIELLSISDGVNLVGLPYAASVAAYLEIKGLSECLVVDRGDTESGVRAATELLVKCGGRRGGTTRHYQGTPQTISADAYSSELRPPPPNRATLTVEFRQEALTR
jgi:hypothetical protein